jgi:glutamyl-tRNA reductase
VPRNVDPTLKQQAGVTLYNIDDLQAIAQQGLAGRQHAQVRGSELLTQQVGHFLRRDVSVSTKEEVAA